MSVKLFFILPLLLCFSSVLKNLYLLYFSTIAMLVKLLLIFMVPLMCCCSVSQKIDVRKYVAFFNEKLLPVFSIIIIWDKLWLFIFIMLVFIVFIFIVLIVILCYVIYFLYLRRRQFRFFKNLKIPGVEPCYIFGNFRDNTMGKYHEVELTKQFYDSVPDEPMIGVFKNDEPILILRDLDSINDVLVKNSGKFYDREIGKLELLKQHFFTLPERAHKPLRSCVSPGFMSGTKRKTTFAVVDKCSDDFIDSLLRNEMQSSARERFECRALFTEYAVVTLSEISGIKIDDDSLSQLRSLRENKSRFPTLNFLRKSVQKHFNFLFKIVRPFCDHFNNNNNNKMYEFFDVLIDTNIQWVRKRKMRSDDETNFLDLLIKYLENPQQVEEYEKNNILIASAYVVFTAGADSIAMVMAFALFEIANNKDIQRKLKEEIKKNEKETLSLDSLRKFTYLDQIFRGYYYYYLSFCFYQRHSNNKTFCYIFYVIVLLL